MAEENQQLAVREVSFENMEKLAVSAAASGMFGITKKEQALCLFAICQAEGRHPIDALRRYHLIEGKPSMRADAMQGEFMAKGGRIIWHVRTDDMVAATLAMVPRNLTPEKFVEWGDKFRERAVKRFEALWRLDAEDNDTERGKTMIELSKLSMEGEETIIRTYADAEEKGLTWSYKKNERTNEYEKKDKVNWKQSPRQMLTARVITEGVRLIAPGLIAGIYTPDEVEDIVHAERIEREEFVRTALEQPDPRDREAIQRMIDQYLADAKDATGHEKSRLLGLASELRVKLAEMDDEIPGIEKPAQAKEVSATLPHAAEPELRLNGEPDPVPVPWQKYKLQHVKQKSLLGKALGDFSKSEIKVVYEKTKNALTSEDDRIRAEAQYIKEAYDALNPEEKNEQNQS